MDTERSKFKKDSQAKGGKDSTKIKLTAAGVVAAGVGAGAGTAAATAWNNEGPHHEEPVQQPQEEISENNTNGQDAQEVQQNSSSQQGTTSTTTGSQQTITEVHPVDSNQTTDVSQPEEPANVSDTITNDIDTVVEEPLKDDETPYDADIDDVDPDLIVQGILTEEVDPNDVDVADVVTIDFIDTMYFEDGSEMPVAIVHTEDNEQYVMVDLDDDMTFDMIFDLEGNPIAPVDGNLTMSDVLDMFDETGDALAYDPQLTEQELIGSENPEQDIVDTTNGDLAMADREHSGEMATITAVSEDDYGDDDYDTNEGDEDGDLAEADEDADDSDMIDDLDA